MLHDSNQTRRIINKNWECCWAISRIKQAKKLIGLRCLFRLDGQIHFISNKSAIKIVLFFSGQFVFKNQYFQTGLKVVPPKIFQILLFPKSSQHIFRKIQKLLDYTYNQYLEEFKNSTRGLESTPPPMGNRVESSIVFNNFFIQRN